VSRTADRDIAAVEQAIHPVQRANEIFVIPAVQAAQPGVGGKREIADHQQRAELERDAARGVSRRVIDVETLAIAERDRSLGERHIVRQRCWCPRNLEPFSPTQTQPALLAGPLR
jgi:hypothetical protein